MNTVTGRTSPQCLHMHRVPEECPQWVADLIEDCRALEPTKRPTARVVYQRLQAGARAAEDVPSDVNS